MKIKELAYLINERHRIYLKKEANKPKPWTNDPILRRYKFTNVFRELDTVSKWLIENWYKPNEDHPNLWFSACLARLINWPETLQELGFPFTWEPDKAVEIMEARRAQKKKVYTGAYMLRCDFQGEGVSKARYTIYTVLTPVYKNFSMEAITTTQEFVTGLSKYSGWGGFLADQAAWDLTYTQALTGAQDAQSWAWAGPGCIRGLNRLYGRPVGYKLKQPQALQQLTEVQKQLLPYLELSVVQHRVPTVRDLENVMCEFDKYQRVKLGEGRPRSTYPGV